MKRNEVIQIRIDPDLQARLQLLRDERHVNVSAWLRNLITAELDREFPPPSTDPAVEPRAPSGSRDDPIPGWNTHLLGLRDWGSRFEGDTSDLPDDLVGLWIIVTNRQQQTGVTRITKVIERTARCVVVQDSGKPKPLLQPESGGDEATTPADPLR